MINNADPCLWVDLSNTGIGFALNTAVEFGPNGEKVPGKSTISVELYDKVNPSTLLASISLEELRDALGVDLHQIVINYRRLLLSSKESGEPTPSHIVDLRQGVSVMKSVASRLRIHGIYSVRKSGAHDQGFF